jgi:DNA-binding NarL/FixJ family response regulator
LLSAVKLYIVDEHESVRTALAERLDRADNMLVVGHCGDAGESVEQVRDTEPDVVLIEVKRKDGMGLELLRQVSTLPNCPKVAVLTSYPSDWEQEAASRAGANYYLLKDIDLDELIGSIVSLVDE